MATQTDVQLCSAAMVRLGKEPITALSDNNKRAKLCNANYARLKDEFLQMFSWNPGTKYTDLTESTFDFVDGDVTVGTDSINEVAHGRLTGDRVFMDTTETLPAGLTANQSYYVIRVDADNFKVAVDNDNAQAGIAVDITAAASGGTHTVHNQPLYGYTYVFNLPSDYVQIESTSSLNMLIIESLGSQIHTDENPFRMQYTYQAAESTFSPLMQKAFILFLAKEFSYSLIQSNDLKDKVSADYDDAIREAKLRDSQEGTPRPYTASTWTDARR